MSLLVAAGLSRRFGAIRALEDVSLDVERGEIHAIAGENGAGKSTLIKVLAGAVVPDRGRVSLDGAALPSGDPVAVRRLGLSVVYQEFTLVPDLTVADNIFLARERGGFVLRRPEMNQAAGRILEDLGVAIPPTAPVRTLSVAHQQMVEIARALATDAKVLVLDEPTASLSGGEVQRLSGVLRRLRAAGLGIVYISHRLDELFALADRVTVLRDGRQVATARLADVSRAGLIRWMVGRDISEEFPTRAPQYGGTVLELRRLGSPGRMADVSLSVRRGEIVGMAGLVGAGRTSAALAVMGAIQYSGDVFLEGQPVRFASPADALAHGVAYVTEDRKGRGIFPDLSVTANITMTHLARFSSGGRLSLSREREAAKDAARSFDVRTGSLAQPARTLSGGNQQKMLLARYLLERPSVLILDEPTRGVDVGARAEIYAMMDRLTAGGLGILMISSDLPEVLGMADRVVVLREGRTTGEVPRAEATAERIMALATLAS